MPVLIDPTNLMQSTLSIAKNDVDFVLRRGAEISYKAGYGTEAAVENALDSVLGL